MKHNQFSFLALLNIKSDLTIVIDSDDLVQICTCIDQDLRVGQIIV